MVMTTHTPRLLPTHTSYPNPVAFGFLIDPESEGMAKYIYPPTVLSDSSEEKKPWTTVDYKGVKREFRRLADICNNILGTKRAHPSCGRLHGDDGRFIGVGDTFIALFKCTRRDDMFMPSKEKLEALKEAMAEEGYTEGLRWFTPT